MIGGLNAATSALRAHSTVMDVAANNIANLNTQGYLAKSATLQEKSPYGVQVASIRATDNPLHLRDVYYNSVSYAEKMNNVELSKERLSEITSLRTYQANAKTIRVVDEMLGTLINIKA